MSIEEFYYIANIFLEYKEYAQMAHIINSRKMQKGKNVIYSDNYVYKVYWNKFDNWKIYDKVDIEESEDIYAEGN